MSANLAQRKSVQWKGEHYRVYQAKTVFRGDNEYPHCPLCGKDAGSEIIVQFEQDGFWMDVFVTCCRCLACHKHYAVRVIVPVPVEERFPEPHITLIPRFTLLERTGIGSASGVSNENK